MTQWSGRSDADSRAAIGGAATRRGINIEESAREAMHAHAAGTTSVEIGGVLVGDVDAETGDVFVAAAIPAHRATSAVASLTFTHEAWDDVNEIIARDYEGLRMVGWYHSHPRFGIFLSEYDVFIQKNFFREEWQVAYVVDPVAEISGVFGWEHGEIVRYPFWNIVARGASKSVREPDRGRPAGQGLAAPTAPPVAVRLENDGPAHAALKRNDTNRFIFGGLAIVLVALIAIGAWLAFGSGKGKPSASATGSGAHRTATTSVPSGSPKGTDGSSRPAGAGQAATSGMFIVGGSDAGNALTEHWSWQPAAGTAGDDLFVATITLSPTARDSLFGTVRNCAPSGVTSVSKATLATDCNLDSPGPLAPGSSELFVFVPHGATSGTDPAAPHYTEASGLPTIGSGAGAVNQFIEGVTSSPAATTTSTTVSGPSPGA